MTRFYSERTNMTDQSSTILKLFIINQNREICIGMRYRNQNLPLCHFPGCNQNEDYSFVTLKEFAKEGMNIDIEKVTKLGHAVDLDNNPMLELECYTATYTGDKKQWYYGPSEYFWKFLPIDEVLSFIKGCESYEFTIHYLKALTWISENLHESFKDDVRNYIKHLNSK